MVYKIRHRYECDIFGIGSGAGVRFAVPSAVNSAEKFAEWFRQHSIDNVWRLDVRCYDELVNTAAVYQTIDDVVASNMVKNISLWVSDKVYHVHDVKGVLQKQYNISDWPSNCLEPNDVFVPDDVLLVAGGKSKDINSLKLKPLSIDNGKLIYSSVVKLTPHRDVLVNRSLMQIWPNDNGTFPGRLVRMFANQNVK